jgi:outer membrane receptor protein involved in Fe transport
LGLRTENRLQDSWTCCEPVQDNWRVSGNWTLTLGLRYENQEPDHSAANFLGAFVPALGEAVRVGTDGVPPGIRDNYYKDIAPRLGGAWDPGETAS